MAFILFVLVTAALGALGWLLLRELKTLNGYMREMLLGPVPAALPPQPPVSGLHHSWQQGVPADLLPQPVDESAMWGRRS